MKVYRAFYGWYDTYDHIGIFKDQVDAWLACDKKYKSRIYYKPKAWVPELLLITKESHVRSVSSRRTRYYIVEEELL